jgi:hypothetical protein
MNLSWPDVAPPYHSATWEAEETPTGEQYLRHCRSVAVGSAVTIVFENRQTLWFRVQELVRLARMTRSETVQTMLKWYEQLMPGRDRLIAAIWVAKRGRRPSRELEIIRRAVALGQVSLVSDTGLEVVGNFLPQSSTDRLALTQWVEFKFTPKQLAAFAELDQNVQFRIESVGYTHESEPIRMEVHLSLLNDLQQRS